MNAAGNKVRMETDPESSRARGGLSGGAVIRSKVRADLERGVCAALVLFLFLLICECAAGEEVVIEKEEEKQPLQHVSPKNKNALLAADSTT